MITLLKEMKFEKKRASRHTSFGWYSSDIVGEFFEKYIGKFNFEDLKIPLRVVATDFRTGEPVFFKSGSLTKALTASCSLTMVFTPVEYQGRLLTDGGVSDPIPTDLAREMGADVIIGVNAGSSQHTDRLDKKLGLGSNPLVKLFPPLHFIKSRHIGTAYFQLLDLLFANYSKAKLQISPADFLLYPNVSHHPQMGFELVEEIALEGEKEALKILPELKKLLG
jgi:NTE family protein